MRSRLPSWALLLYLAIDLANPFVPGAFRFAAEEGVVWVEGLAQPREEVGARDSESVSGPSPRPPACDGQLRAAPTRGRAGRLADWLARIRAGDPTVRDRARPDADDH
jgi:hypothetical protein